MILDDELIAKITKIANRITPVKKVNYFFINIFGQFSDKDKAKIISIFIKKQGKIIFYHYVNNHENIKKIIKEACTSGINSFYESLDNNESNSYFDLINLYLNINKVEVEKNTLDKIMHKFNKMLAENSINNNDVIIELLINYIRFMVYRYTENKESIKIINESQSFAIFESIIIKYIENLKIDDKSLNDNLLMLLLEARKLPGLAHIAEILTKKGDNNSLSDFCECIKSNVLVNSDKFDKFCESIILYKLSNAILPKEVCIYLHKFYSENDKLIRIANMDLIQNYWQENGINDVICFNDQLLYFPGLAGTKYMAVKHNDLSQDIFHEARHIIQKNNVLNNKNFVRYGYDMLKDFLIQKNISWSDYNGINHDRFLFEIDADIQGARECGMIFLSIGQNVSEVEQEMSALNEIEQERISKSKTIIINGTEVNKKELFDSIILKNPDYIKIFPVFSIEYHDDGSKKTNDEILSTLESYKLNQVYTEEELSAIETCIFGNSLENKKSIR